MGNGGGGCSGSPCNDPTLCRSKWGFCGSSPDHCNDESTWKAGGCGSGTTVTTTTAGPVTVGPTTTTAGLVTVSPTSVPGSSIQSGDVVFLKTRAGSGKHIDVEGSSVRARWESQGS